MFPSVSPINIHEVCDSYKEEKEWTVNDDVWAAVNFDKLYTIKKTDTESVSETETASEAATE